MTDVIEKRLLAVEKENRDLRGRLEALQTLLSPAKPASPRRDEPQVKITTPPLAKVVLPTQDEFRRLRTIVFDRYPQLAPRDEDPDDAAAQFRAAFIRLAHCGRRDKVDTQRGLSYWCDDASEWCRRHQVNPTWIGGSAFTAAVIAHGDIRFVMNNWPHDAAFALQFGGGGAPAREWWRRALAGALLDPVPPSYPRAVASPSRVRRV